MSEEKTYPKGYNPPHPLKKGTELTVTTESAAFNGLCVARVEGMAFFLSGCVPGDTVRARVHKKRKSYAEGVTLEVLSPGPNRVEPPCDYFGDCGGCKWQNLAYESQIYWKGVHVRDAFERIGGLTGVDVRETIGCEQPFWYRNKMEYSFSVSRWLTQREIDSGEDFDTSFALGLHAPGRFDKVIDVKECLLQSELSNRVRNVTREFCREHHLVPYTTRTHEGFLRNLVVRTSEATDELMVVLITSRHEPVVMEAYRARMMQEVPEVTTLVNGVTSSKAQVAFSEELYILVGDETITEEIAGNRFTISPFSFFQTNTRQGNVLYEEALEAAAIESDDVVWDLYCGAGTITLAAARRGGHVVGVEMNEGAVRDARENAKRNGLSNVDFYAGDLKDLIVELEQNESDIPRPDIVIVDPPRAGLHENVVRRLLALAPARIVYVSCNPTTQARDCALFAERYRIDYVRPVDMFPQTYHIETVARLTLIDEPIADSGQND